MKRLGANEIYVYFRQFQSSRDSAEPIRSAIFFALRQIGMYVMMGDH